MRATYVLRNGELVEKHIAGPLHRSNDAPMVISDTIDGFRSMADGQMYDSKSRYRADLRARGLIEVGNDPQANRAPENMLKPWNSEPVEMTIKRAIESLER